MALRILLLHVLMALALSAMTVSAEDYTAVLAKALRERAATGLNRELKAATKAAHLEKRHSTIFTVTQVDLSYAESKSTAIRRVQRGLTFQR